LEAPGDVVAGGLVVAHSGDHHVVEPRPNLEHPV
jgi:hypothetical protein